MIVRLVVLFLFFLSFFFFPEAEAPDPYKVLGVDKNASQREIQKAFHKLSLKYHPDKNKAKSAQAKFAEINNAYEILSDEDKRKNYDLYGDEKGGPRFDTNSHGDKEGYTYFTSGGQGNSGFSFRPGGWQRMGGQGDSQSFTFSFGGPSESTSSFSFGDMFSNLFGSDMKGGNQFSGFGSSGGSRSGFSSSGSIQPINSQRFKKEVSDQGLTWLLLIYAPYMKEYQFMESIVGEVANSLQGAIKAGSINCQNEQALCKDLGVWSSRSPRVYVYSYRTKEKGSLLEYGGDLDAKNLKSYCQEHLPRFSKRIDIGQFDFSSRTTEALPQVLLLSMKKDTPLIWRTLSGLYRKLFIFYDVEVRDASDPLLKKLGVDELPAVVGRLSNGDMYVLKTGPVKDLQSGISEIGTILDSFEKMNKKATSSQSKRPSKTESMGRNIPHLSVSNKDGVCGDNTPVCIIGAFRSSKAKEKLESILSTVSQKTLTRRQNQAYSTKDSVSYSLLDADMQQVFLNSFDKSGFKSSDKIVVAYKPRRKKFAVFTGEYTHEEIERFISSVLNGDIRFSEVRQTPVLK